MNIFSLFKKFRTQQTPQTPAAILRLTQEYIPSFYKDSERFKESKEFMDHHEWGLALDSLVEMAVESEHYFSEDFWNNLATCADKMDMKQEAEFCLEQIARNEKEIGGKIPIGWTTIKIDDTHYEHHIADIVKNEWVNDRRQKDNFNELIKIDGFHIKYHGRTGLVYFVDKGKVLEIDFEMSAVGQYDLLLYFDQLKEWTLPKNEPFAFKEQAAIREKLLAWLKSQRIKTDLG